MVQDCSFFQDDKAPP
uniref:Uncharacterized protein n=1 Tax=Bracon brevicornis TaxID=1563983 RepID=A0A6V7K9J1_9HYME